jgi:hypothetical protein
MEATIHTSTSQAPVERKLSLIQKYALMSFHPRKLFFDALSYIWFTYFIWNHAWQAGILVGVCFRVIGFMSILGTRPELMLGTFLGKIGLLHFRISNFIFQILGFIPLIYGIWKHSIPFLLIGLSFLLLGHVFGWEDVDSHFIMDVKSRNVQ